VKHLIYIKIIILLTINKNTRRKINYKAKFKNSKAVLIKNNI